MEKVVYISDIHSLAKISPLNFSRLYYGNEFCGNLIPDIEDIKKVLNYLKNKSLEFSFVTPWCRDSDLEKLKKIFAILPKHSEIIFNDWGVSELINRFKNKKFKKILGRLLVRYSRDPRIILLDKERNKRLINYLMTSNINNDAFQLFLIENGIYRIEIENSFQGYNFKLDERLSSSLYYPYVFVTTTTKCLFKQDFNSPHCKFQCKDKTIIWKIKNLAHKIIIQGNTEFYFGDRKVKSKSMKQWKVNRLVFMPKMTW